MSSPRSRQQMGGISIAPPQPDPRVGLKAGSDGRRPKPRGTSRSLSKTPAVGEVPRQHELRSRLHRQVRHSGQLQRLPDLGHLESDRARRSRSANYCPASQSDVSVYKNLLFVSAEGNTGRIDCGDEGVKDTVSDGPHPRHSHLRHQRHRASEERRQRADLPRLAHAHACSSIRRTRTTSTSTSRARPACARRASWPAASTRRPEQDPNSALFRIEVIKVPLAHPEQAAIVSSPRIFNDLAAPHRHGEAPDDIAAQTAAGQGAGDSSPTIIGAEQMICRRTSSSRCSTASSRRATAPVPPTGADSAALRDALPGIIAQAGRRRPGTAHAAPTQCHDITVYPAIGLAGGACEGYGMLLDIRDPTHPVRLARRRRLELLLLALGHVQQRRHEAALLR